MTTLETILNVVPGATDHERLVVVHRSMPSSTDSSRPRLGLFDPKSDATSAPVPVAEASLRTFCQEVHAVRERPVVLRQESFSPAVGWFTQSELEMTESQWAMMRSTLIPTQPRVTSKRCRPNPYAASIVPFHASA